MREVTEHQFFAEIKRLGKAGLDPMPGRGKDWSESIWKNHRSNQMTIVGKSVSDGIESRQYFLV